ncbi:hypothetical protein QTP88_025872 [Uroleucon formosanum]
MAQLQQGYKAQRKNILHQPLNSSVASRLAVAAQPHKHRKLTNQLSVHWKNIIIDAGENARGVRLRPTKPCRLQSRRLGNDYELERIVTARKAANCVEAIKGIPYSYFRRHCDNGPPLISRTTNTTRVELLKARLVP